MNETRKEPLSLEKSGAIKIAVGSNKIVTIEVSMQ